MIDLEPRPIVMIVEARFYKNIADEMMAGAIAVLEKMDVEFERFAVPGAFEIPAAIKFALHAAEVTSGNKTFDGYIALGCVIRGETSHYDYVCGESARGLMDLINKYSLAVGYGILTCDNREQAWERASRNKGDKGAAAAKACLDMILIKNRLGKLQR